MYISNEENDTITALCNEGKILSSAAYVIKVVVPEEVVTETDKYVLLYFVGSGKNYNPIHLSVRAVSYEELEMKFPDKYKENILHSIFMPSKSSQPCECRHFHAYRKKMMIQCLRTKYYHELGRVFFCFVF